MTRRLCIRCAPRSKVRTAIVRALRKHGSIRLAAAALGVPRSTLHDRATALGIASVR